MVFLKTYNFFPSIPPTQDQQQLRNQLISTRLFIILLTLSLTILLLYNSLITVTQTNTVTFPTITTYLQLYSEYPQSLSCDCKQISINHDKFLHITYTFHEICSSAFTTSRWLDYLTDARPHMILFRDDFRASSGIAVFQTLITFCDLSSETIENRLREFYSGQFVSASLLSSELFYLQIESLITQFISTTTNTFLLSLSSIRKMTQGNVLFSATLTNYEFVPLSNHYFLSNPYTYDNCSCSLSGSCFEPYPIFNGLDRTVILYTVPGMNAACYPVEAVLQSDLRCFYNQTCITQVQSYFNESSPMNVSALDPSLLGEFKIIEKKDSCCPLDNIHEQKLVDELYQILEEIATSSSYQVEDESRLYYDDEIDDMEVDEENDPNFDGSDNEEDREDDALLRTFSLEYMQNVELHSTRTLSYQGEKLLVAGEVVGPIYLCLKEPDRRISENVRAKMFQPRNIVITCSKSGKLTKSLVHYWSDMVLVPNAPEKCLLLSDAWPTQSDVEIYKKVSGCKRLGIP
ncbi:unnamed protein product [Adineta ricciae]|uniref:Uncharacterized protein n=1 Tax=Adineta ricciae TaxID=249248 RepID=A0A816A3L0_ADIRI|nr:unnamed protein product [Adineta ricciae]